MKIGIAADHGGFELKEKIAEMLKKSGYTVVDYGAFDLQDQDDYPDFVIPLAKAVASGQMERGIAICGSGVGASIAANKIPGARAALITDVFSAHQGVEDDNMNIICFGGRVCGPALVWDLTQTFLSARFTAAERHQRRLGKVMAVEASTVQRPVSSVKSGPPAEKEVQSPRSKVQGPPPGGGTSSKR